MPQAHWDHPYLANWDKTDKRSYPTGKHRPDLGDVGSNFFPQLGAYSSNDPAVVESHMGQIRRSGAGVIVFSWYPPESADPNGQPVDSLLPALLEAAQGHGLKVSLHIEPYQGRSIKTLKRDLEYVTKSYGDHPAFYKVKTQGGRYDMMMTSYSQPTNTYANLLSTFFLQIPPRLLRLRLLHNVGCGVELDAGPQGHLPSQRQGRALGRSVFGAVGRLQAPGGDQGGVFRRVLHVLCRQWFQPRIVVEKLEELGQVRQEERPHVLAVGGSGLCRPQRTPME